uniref:Putative gamma-glutamylcyclotransferase n=1 Tax=Kalanchoe fedtschenkoi TaxID=63787 RepID=A0A7N0VCR1_KALFE
MAGRTENQLQLSLSSSGPEETKKADDEAVKELPEYLVYSILLLLPLKILLRFCCVSKQWRDVITSRRFYLDRRPVQSGSASNPVVDDIVHWFVKKQQMLFRMAIHRVWGGGGHDPQESLGVDVPFFDDGSEPHEEDFFHVSSLSCDGLLCVVYQGHLANRIIVWNPYARKSRSVSWPVEFEDDCFDQSVFVGFGYDEAVSDYKVVVVKSPDSVSGAWPIQVLLGITPPELEVLDAFEDVEYERRDVELSLEDSSEKLHAYAYVWENKNDANLYGDWDFEAWKRDHLKDFAAMTKDFMKELEQPESKPRVATYEQFYEQDKQ